MEIICVGYRLPIDYLLLKLYEHNMVFQVVRLIKMPSNSVISKI